MRFDLSNPNKIEQQVLPIKDLMNVVAIEFDLKNNCLFWADIVKDVIGVSLVNQNNSRLRLKF